jgi:hypothetical protein
VCACPLRGRLRRRDELRDHLAGGAPGGFIKRIGIFPHGAPCRRQLLPVDLIGTGERALLIGVGCNQTGINGEALTIDQALRYCALHHQLEQLTKSVTIAEATMTGLRKRRVIGNATLQSESAEME